MTRWQMFKAAVKGVWQTWRNKRREERWLKKMSEDVEVKLWKPKVSASKAKALAIPVGVAAAIISMLRALLGDKLPWGPENDAWMAGILLTALTAGWTYFRDKKNHHGGGVFHTLTPEQQIAQTAGLNRMHETAVENRAAKEKETP